MSSTTGTATVGTLGSHIGRRRPVALPPCSTVCQVSAVGGHEKFLTVAERSGLVSGTLLVDQDLRDARGTSASASNSATVYEQQRQVFRVTSGSSKAPFGHAVPHRPTLALGA